MRPGTVINISGTTPVTDPEYRYKMPVVYGKIEGRGNGIKTVIPNITELANSLHRTPAEVNKFFGCELGAQTSYSGDNDRAIVNGAHNDASLQCLIHKYVELFVLCPQCGLPETEYKIKNGCIFHKCAACGSKEMVDMSHKLCTFILSQDKKDKKSKKEKSKDKNKDKKDGDEKEKKKKKKEGSDEEKKRNKKDKKRKEKKEKLGKNVNENRTVEGKIDEICFSDCAPGIPVLGEKKYYDEHRAIDMAVLEIQKFIKENFTASYVRIAEEVANQQMSYAVKAYQRIHIFIRAAISRNFYKEHLVKKYAPIIHIITQGNPIMERHLISAAEFICSEKTKNFPVLLKQLFDEEVLQENVILDWAFSGRSDYTPKSIDEETRASLRAEAEPVIAWLQVEESSDDETKNS